MLLRRAALPDLEGVLRLYGQLNPDDGPPDLAKARGACEAILASPHFELWVAELDGRVAATCYLNVVPNLSRGVTPYAVLENVVTDEALRGRGIGKALVQHVLQRAFGLGCYKVMLLTGSRRESTHAFYRACGFSGDDKFAYVARPGPSPLTGRSG